MPDFAAALGASKAASALLVLFIPSKDRQNKRIKQERKEGEITKGQAQQLHSEDHAIRGEERTMASTNGGHVTKTEQKALNQQENQVSQQIGK